MKDIGEIFKQKREEIGIKVIEAANDLEITEAQLENLEDGNVNAFKDIFFLKDLIKKYAKYLNVDENEVMSDFNEFVFNFTSRIPVEEIQAKIKEIEKENEKEDRKRISSPYTKKKVKKAKLEPIVIYSIITVILVSFTLLLLNLFLIKKEQIINIGSDNLYELAK